MKNLILAVIIGLLTFSAHAKNDKKEGYESLPPGLKKKMERTGELPPGWEKKLSRGDIMEPRIYDYARQYRLSKDDYRRYGIDPRVNTEVMRVEDKIIRIKSDTREILDIFGL